MNNIGYAVDLGTTTIDACLFDINRAEFIAKESRKNEQSLYGSDVINRILNASRNVELHSKLISIIKNELLDILSSMLSKLANNKEYKNCIGIKDIAKFVISGNTTMISILLGYDVESLGHAPFTSRLQKSVIISGDELFGLESGISCDVLLTGCASAFIGGDVLAGLTFLDTKYNSPFSNNGNNLLLDLGTNGEMVLNAGGKLFATSAACGPAFEGCTRRQGVYGATTIDSIALLLKTKKLTLEGILKEEYIENGISINGMHLDMDIIRNILLAKAAIYSGISCLLDYAGVSFQDIKNVYLAGGFGFYLDVDNAVYIGLLPEDFKDKIIVCGNTSLSGAVELVKSEDKLNYLDVLTNDKIELVQLADLDLYKDLLIENMTFKR